MFNNFLASKNIKIQDSFKDKSYRKAFIAIVLFIVFNALKNSLYNLFLIPVTSKDVFVYKFFFTLLCSIIVYSVVFSFKSRYVFLTIFVIQCVYIFTNISYYLYYHSYLHFLQWISLFKEAFISATHLANPISIKLLVVFMDVPIAFYIFFKCFKTEVRKYKLPILRYGVLIISIIILLFVEINNYSTGRSIVHYMDDRYTGETEIVERYGTLVNSTVNIIKNYSETKLMAQFNYGAKQTYNAISNGKTNNSSYIKNAKRPNFVIIQVESMDANIVKQQYKDSYVMPFLSSQRENSVYYPYTLSYHKGGGTSDTEFSIINSIEPLDSFPAIKLTSYDYPNSVISKLHKQAYTTMAFHGNVGTFYNRNIAFSKMGFEKFYDINSMKYEDKGWGAPDADVFSFAFDKMKKSNKPFLSYIITMTSHGPFESARNYYNNNKYDDIENEIVKNYFNSMNYVDNSIKDMVKKIQSEFSNTYIIIYGDHTPNINTEAYHQASFIDEDKYFEFVPLFIITPDKQKYSEDSIVASFLDISPTILKSSGIPYTVYSDGINLLSFNNKNPLHIPLKNETFNRLWLYDKISNNTYDNNEPLWMKYLPSFISSNLIERHRR